ncbi:class Ib ribonucleoside-diphosphate reductase assembly flavoprotein NrdI [Mycetocola saprophilus]|uniref:class Ib ribonucleoside-diphosphate reductase assembly flavoprotein NrdI n=1 Tax=Mycetocola saprophilus TaxID=76636 RepID=UPI001B80AC4F|nr:class Ib ribonucleoside-diphosphate reductase assembly flavoprotein NrdI [Mycetocola saprophilus]
MVQLVYFSGDSGNTHRFVQSLGIEAMRIGDAEHRTPICLTEPFVLLTPTYGGGADYAAIPRPVRQFLARADNRARLRGVIGAGHRNFGFAFCLASRLLADQYNVPELYRLDGVGTDQDRERILTALSRVLGMAPARVSVPVPGPVPAPNPVPAPRSEAETVTVTVTVPAPVLTPVPVQVPAPQVAPPPPLRRSRIRTGAQPIVGEFAPTVVAAAAAATVTATATPAATAPTMPVVETTAAVPASAAPRSTPASAAPPSTPASAVPSSRGADAGAPAAPVTRSGRRAARLAAATGSGASQSVNVNVNVPVDPPAARTPSVPPVTIEGNRSEPAASRGRLSPPPVIAGTIVNPVPTLTTVAEPMRTRSRPAAVPVASTAPLTQVAQQTPAAPLAPTIPVREPVARVSDPSPMVPRRARRLAVAEDSGIPSPGPAPTRRSLRQDRG